MVMADHFTPHRLGLIAITGCILGGLSLLEQQSLNARQRFITPIVIIDRLNFVRNLPVDEDAHQRKSRLETFESTLNHLKDAGYLVLDTSAILAAPSELYAQIPPTNVTP
ncbi:MAG: hypothetical protein EBY15_12795 [Gammaproteobacteria bacterium]|nr:hypothetical protein [Gammaproteobacteria bacterium]